MGKLVGGNENRNFTGRNIYLVLLTAILERSDEMYMLKTKQRKNSVLCFHECLFSFFFVVHPPNRCWMTFQRIQIPVLFFRWSMEYVHTLTSPKRWKSLSWNCLHKTALNKQASLKFFWYASNCDVIPNIECRGPPMTTAKITVVTSVHERCHGHSEEGSYPWTTGTKIKRNAGGLLWILFIVGCFVCRWVNHLCDLHSYGY